MSTEHSSTLTLESAHKILTAFSCIDNKTIASESEKAQLRQALLLFTDLSDAQNFGICADNAAEGLSALKSYLNALGYKADLDQADIPAEAEPMYIKFNTQRMSHYLSPYPGEYRGVLVSCQSSEEDAVNGTYGHFPLDLFEDA
ncbi:MAG: DUF1824 family protein [Kastovskya adunca ATA6-11-RM4]|jgi:hypothetical protein|nr:DUF1824 family protein [Kastovskya adunca ATA6-11-RM4]